MTIRAPQIAASITPNQSLLTDVEIRSIKTVIVDAPTKRRHMLSNTEVTHQSYVHVQMQLENGIIGYGEASTLGGPRWSEESVESIKSTIDTYIAPRLIGQPACNFEANALIATRSARRNYSAKGAIESAALDAVGKTMNVPSSALLGGAVRDRFPVFWTLASGDAAQEVEEAKEKIELREFNRFKIKLGFSSIKNDIARITALRNTLGDDTLLIVDVNQGWNESKCIRWMPALKELGVALIEQPLPADELNGMARIALRSDIPIMLDESVFTNQQAGLSGAAGAGSVLSLKLVKSGGLFELKRIAGTAVAHGISLYGGCLLESSIGAAAHLSVFATLPSLEWGTEHFAPRILVEDLAETSLKFEDFKIILPNIPGIGVTPDLDKIASFARKS